MARIQPVCWCCASTGPMGPMGSHYCIKCQSCQSTMRLCGATGASINWPDHTKAARVPRNRSNYCQCPSCGAEVAEGVPHKAPRAGGTP